MIEITDQEFLAWVKTKPADERFDYYSNTNCAFAQFLRATNRAESPSVSGFSWRDDDGVEHSLPPLTENALVSHTFGGLAKKLEAGIAGA